MAVTERDAAGEVGAPRTVAAVVRSLDDDRVGTRRGLLLILACFRMLRSVPMGKSRLSLPGTVTTPDRRISGHSTETLHRRSTGLCLSLCGPVLAGARIPTERYAQRCVSNWRVAQGVTRPVEGRNGALNAAKICVERLIWHEKGSGYSAWDAHPVAVVSEVAVDLRTRPCGDVTDRVERCLAVRLDREAAVVKRRSVGARTDRDTWIRIEARPFSKLAGQGSGVEGAACLPAAIAKPEWYQGLSWQVPEQCVLWRADETERAADQVASVVSTVARNSDRYRAIRLSSASSVSRRHSEPNRGSERPVECHSEPNRGRRDRRQVFGCGDKAVPRVACRSRGELGAYESSIVRSCRLVGCRTAERQRQSHPCQLGATAQALRDLLVPLLMAGAARRSLR